MENYHSQVFPEPQTQPTAGKRGGFRRFVLDLTETILLSLVLFLGINAISARIRIESISMQPTLYAGNFVIVNKIAYFLNQPQRGISLCLNTPPILAGSHISSESLACQEIRCASTMAQCMSITSP